MADAAGERGSRHGTVCRAGRDRRTWEPRPECGEPDTGAARRGSGRFSQNPTPVPDLSLLTSPDAVVFDLDGTLIDSRGPFVRSLNHTFEAYGRPTRSPEELHPFLGPPTQETFGKLFADTPELIGEAIEFYRSYFGSLGAEGTMVYPGLRELLSSLQGRVPLAIATSKLLSMSERVLKELELRSFFDVVCGPAAGVTDEPKRVTLGRALEQLGHPKRAVMIGDRMHDVHGAAAHGLPVIGVLWGAGSEKELREAGATVLVREAGEIPPLLGF